MKINDALGLGEVFPLKKLIDVIVRGTGRVTKAHFDRKDIDTRAYEIKKLAEARADEVKIISQAVHDSYQLTGGIKYREDSFHILSPKQLSSVKPDVNLSVPPLEERTQSRVDFQEAKRQLNIESVTAYAAEDLRDEPPVTDEALDEGWTTRFFNIVEDVSNDEMQVLWGKILAGEIKKPKSYSLRALEVLRNLTKEEAECFMKFGQFAIKSKNTIFLLNFNNEKLLEDKYNLNFGDRLLLQELGLINSNDLSFIIDESKESKTQIVFQIGSTFVLAKKEPNLPEQHLSALVFTKIGQELLQLIETKPQFDYIQLLASKIRKEGVTVQNGTILEIIDGHIRHNGLVDVPFTEEELKNKE